MRLGVGYTKANKAEQIHPADPPGCCGNCTQIPTRQSHRIHVDAGNAQEAVYNWGSPCRDWIRTGRSIERGAGRLADRLTRPLQSYSVREASGRRLAASVPHFDFLARRNRRWTRSAKRSYASAIPSSMRLVRGSFVLSALVRATRARLRQYCALLTGLSGILCPCRCRRKSS
jgi:hypothetical protein